MYILGISAYFHDSAACLLRDDVIVAAVQEERFSRKKNDESFPAESIRYCLETANISLAEVDHIVFYEKPFLKFERLLETYLAFAPKGFTSFIKAVPLWLKDKLFLKGNIIKALKEIDPVWQPNKHSVLFTTHHQSHAASAFYPSPFNKAIILTADGVGEWATTSIARGSHNSIEFIRDIPFPHSIGLLYSAFTYYLGFKVNVDEYKVMGLAPYGKPLYVDIIFKHLVDLKPDGSFLLDMAYFNYCTGLTMTAVKFNELFGAPPRKASGPITQFYMDMASSIQTATEQIMLRITTAIHQEFGVDNLCMAGGVALNCVANGLILKESGFKNIWIQPAAGDAGGALGAAYAVYYEHLDKSRITDASEDKMQNALLGPCYSRDGIAEDIKSAGLQFIELSGQDYYRVIAGFIVDGKVVGYFKGRMEYGPRALGARSILADPRRFDMQSVLNQKIKYRESFRPFAPAVLEEYAATYFNISCASPYMLLVADVAADLRIPLSEQEEALQGVEKLKVKRSVIPAVTHVNYTARLQTVNKESHPDFYNLIKAFHELTDCPLLINTSFNRMDEPIVNTPLQAIACFRETDMDVLVIENFIIQKTNTAKN
ncbi:carbamoyltransferase [Mucilaginibacter sp. SP1R1]|uniref:carbamoyltransferase family protein n=1 Tax=Mucilaginibacter sp. SP1R1 TaxID=2723091 RepID=UPI00160776E4|nr:carbamoyltransferase [Mucilaginibacter sp. SP1R1]MBB6147685.1 carbamoyltransferase [Mucilaginibacter sp. SP1R1]